MYPHNIMFALLVQLKMQILSSFNLKQNKESYTGLEQFEGGKTMTEFAFLVQLKPQPWYYVDT